MLKLLILAPLAPAIVASQASASSGILGSGSGAGLHPGLAHAPGAPRQGPGATTVPGAIDQGPG